VETAKTVGNFLSGVRNAKDERAIKTLKITSRELELFLGALNALPENSLDIPDLNGIAEKMGISSPYIFKLKKRKLIKHGKKRGEYVITDFAVKKMEKYLSNEPESEAPAADGGKKTRKSRKPSTKRRAVKSNLDFEKMTIGQIRSRISEIDSSLASLGKERSELVAAVKDQLGSIK
jgi:hypothetical protein